MKRLSGKRKALLFIPLAILLTIVLPVAIAGCSSGDEDKTSGAPDGESGLVTIRLTDPTVYSEYVIADELGYFKEEGIQLEYVGKLDKGVTQYQLIEQGEVDFFTGHPPTTAQARLAGIKAIAVAPGMIDDPKYPHVQYLVPKDSPLQSLDEAIGHKVAVSSVSPCTDGYVRYYLKSKGFNPDDAEYVIINQDLQEQSASQGLVDITSSHPPYGGKALASGDFRELTNTWEIFNSPGAGLSVRGFSDEFIEKHPDTVQGFVNAMYRARIWANNNVEEAKKINAKYLGLDPEDVSIFIFDENKNIDPEYIQLWFDIAEDIDLWEPGDILPKDVYTNEFVPKDIPASDSK